MDNVFVLGLILILVLCIVIVLNSKTRQKFSSSGSVKSDDPCTGELKWNYMMGEQEVGG